MTYPDIDLNGVRDIREDRPRQFTLSHFGGIEHDLTDPWERARELGLTEADYGATWAIYESKQDYLDSLD